jgi:hypothetical protein
MSEISASQAFHVTDEVSDVEIWHVGEDSTLQPPAVHSVADGNQITLTLLQAAKATPTNLRFGIPLLWAPDFEEKSARSAAAKLVKPGLPHGVTPARQWVQHSAHSDLKRGPLFGMQPTASEHVVMPVTGFIEAFDDSTGYAERPSKAPLAVSVMVPPMSVRKGAMSFACLRPTTLKVVFNNYNAHITSMLQSLLDEYESNVIANDE